MASTIIGLNDPKAVKKFSTTLANDVARDSYFQSRFMGDGEASLTPIQRFTDLETDAGDQISYDLSMQLKQNGVEGDDTLEGTEESLTFYTDALYIDQKRKGVKPGGRMTRKRTVHDLRLVARTRLSEWWQRYFDEQFFMYLSGARGINPEFIEPLNFAGRANNSLDAPDSSHLLYGGSATSKATLANTDKMALPVIDKLIAMAKMMGGGSVANPRIQPIMIDGEKHFVMVMSPFQEYDVRTSTSTAQWLDIQKAAATALGKGSPIFLGGLGMYNNVILHVHDGVIRFSDYGAGANLAAARALFMGVQACVVAFGNPAGKGTSDIARFSWFEETDDRGNQLVVDTNTIFGIKKTRYNSKDFGLISVDTYAAQPY